MNDIFLLENGTLSRKENTLLFKTDEENRFFPIKEVECVFIFGSITINSSLISFLNKNNVMLYFFGYYGNFTGYYHHFNKVDNSIRIKQYEAYLGKKRSLIRREIIKSQKHNMISFLRHYVRVKKLDLRDVHKFYSLYHEGVLWSEFYECIKKLVPDEFYFDKRSYNPPEDKFNSLLSFVNALLYSYVLREIFKTALDPEISFLHSSNEKRFSLVYDIADIFKPYFCFSVIMSLLNLKILKTSDFNEDLTLNYHSKKKVLKKMESFMARTVYHKNLKRYVSLKYLIRNDLYNLMKFLRDKDQLDLFKKWW